MDCFYNIFTYNMLKCKNTLQKYLDSILLLVATKPNASLRKIKVKPMVQYYKCKFQSTKRPIESWNRGRPLIPKNTGEFWKFCSVSSWWKQNPKIHFNPFGFTSVYILKISAQSRVTYTNLSAPKYKIFSSTVCNNDASQITQLNTEFTSTVSYG